MINKADAVVIGGGIMGASTAHHLTKLGYGKVVLLEQKFWGSGATGFCRRRRVIAAHCPTLLSAGSADA